MGRQLRAQYQSPKWAAGLPLRLPLPSVLSTSVCTAPSPRQTGLQSKEPRLFAAAPQQSGEAGMGMDS